jgi:hypothetical protein
MKDNKHNDNQPQKVVMPEITPEQALRQIIANHKLNAEKVMGSNNKVLRKD